MDLGVLLIVGIGQAAYKWMREVSMPVSVKIKDDIAEVVWSGTFRLSDVSESLDAVSDILDSRESIRILIRDDIQVFHFEAEEARQVAYLLEILKSKGVKRTCFIASKRVHYGIGRMITAYCEMAQVEFDVFLDEKSAMEWLLADSSPA